MLAMPPERCDQRRELGLLLRLRDGGSNQVIDTSLLVLITVIFTYENTYLRKQ